MVIDIENGKRKEDFLKILSENNGIVLYACQKMGLQRATYYSWLKNDESFKERVEQIKEEVLDHVEGKQLELINGVTVQDFNPVTGEKNVYTQIPCKSSIQFFLKAKGGQRGYNEKIDISSGGKEIKAWTEPTATIIVNGLPKSLDGRTGNTSS